MIHSYLQKINDVRKDISEILSVLNNVVNYIRQCVVIQTANLLFELCIKKSGIGLRWSC